MLDILRFKAVSALRRCQRRPLRPAHCAASDLPPEILGEIFLHCISPDEWGSFSSRDAPLLLTKICREWREAALSRPELWSVLPFLRMHPRRGHLRLFKLYLEYSARAALSIGFELPRHPDDAPSLSLITPYLSQSQHLNIIYFDDVPDLEPFITHTHFPLLKSLELSCEPPRYTLAQVLRDQLPPIARLEGAEFPWTQLTQLTIQFRNTIETLTLLRNCSSLEVFRLKIGWYAGSGASHTPPGQNLVHHHLRKISFEDDSSTGLFVGLLGCFITPALSTLEFIRSDTLRWDVMQSILSFIRNSSAELTSLTLNGIKCSSKQLTDLSTLMPMVTELDLYGLDGDSLRLLTIKSDSPHNILFPDLERLVIRYYPVSYFDRGLPYSDMFHSRLYLAPNSTIVEDMLPLQHAELHLGSLFDCGLPDLNKSDRPDGQDLCKLIESLWSVYSGAVNLDRYVFGGVTRRHQESMKKQARIYDINRSAFPTQHELGYWAGRLPIGETARFFRKLDAVFTALEGYHITHPVAPTRNLPDILMHKFSCISTTAFLHNPAYKFHIRAAHLLKRWQLIISEYEAGDRWTCKYDFMMDAYKLVHRRAADM
ncbi:hypothetical protein BD779DRAFT_816572 [Infundibulicybe gibba]|nr:hypothetical protein BD779DRAFT_816572 [Infundibulicybe gibba]